MISDSLTTAAQQIDRYLDQFPEAYAGREDIIAKVVSVMMGLKVLLDCAPTADPQMKQLQDGVEKALAALNVMPIRLAVEVLHCSVENARGRGKGGRYLNGEGHGGE